MKTNVKAALDITASVQDAKFKTHYTTDQLKEKLNQNKRLNFIMRGMKIIVFPEEDRRNERGGKIKDYNLVFVNGIEQRFLKSDSEDYKKRFRNYKELNQNERDILDDWRYLLDLNFPKNIPKNVLWEYFETDIQCPYDKSEFIPFPKEYPNMKIEARTLLEAEHYGRIWIAIDLFEKNKLKQPFNKMKKNKKLRRANNLEAQKRQQKKHLDEVSKFKMVCLKHIPTGYIERVQKYKAERFANKENGNYKIVEKYEWKTYLRKLREENKSKFNDGLCILPNGDFPYKKSEYSGIRRKDRRFNPKGRTYNRLVKQIRTSTKYETYELDGKTKIKYEDTEDQYNSFLMEPIYEKVEINFHKYKTVGFIREKTDEIWATTYIYKKVGYEKIPFVYTVKRKVPIILQKARTLNLYLNSKKPKKKEIEVKSNILKKRKINYIELENGIIKYNNKKYRA
jgi:hypothetical protein